jgi:uncharacterized protein YggE
MIRLSQYAALRTQHFSYKERLMNRLSLALAALGLVAVGLFLGRDALAPQQALGQADKAKKVDEEKRFLTTAGTASVTFKPDSARVFLRVDSEASDIAAARALNNKSVRKVMDTLKALQIPDLKMKSDNITVTQVFEPHPPNDRLPKVIGYRISYHFTALVENEEPAKLSEYSGKILDTALANGANNLDQILIFRKNQEQFRREALTKAVETALANARALAAGANKNVVEVTAISGQPEYRYFGGNVRLQNTLQVAIPQAGDDSSTPVMAGNLVITCNVNVTCRY